MGGPCNTANTRSLQTDKVGTRRPDKQGRERKHRSTPRGDLERRLSVAIVALNSVLRASAPLVDSPRCGAEGQAQVGTDICVWEFSVSQHLGSNSNGNGICDKVNGFRVTLSSAPLLFALPRETSDHSLVSENMNSVESLSCGE